MDISHFYRIARRHVTLNNSVLAVALLIVVGSVEHGYDITKTFSYSKG